jgi:tetratricopeptide (TPR) repeat protein
MSRSRNEHAPLIVLSLGWALCLCLATSSANGQAAKTAARVLPRVSPDQMHKPEWLNRQIEIEDRISDFRKHGTKIDEIAIKGSPVPLKLAGPMRLERPSPLPRGRFQGRVIKVGNLFQFMVTDMHFLPSEREELASKVAALPAGDAQKRLELAAWADSVGERYGDASLKQSAKTLRAESFRILGMKEDAPGTPPGSTAIAAARDAQKSGADVSIVRSLAHLGLDKAVKSTTDQAGLESLSREIAELLPDATKKPEGKLSDQAATLYAADPLNAYVAASVEDRRMLDRDLMARAMEKGLLAAADNQPDQLEAIVDIAKRQFPERPELADSIRDRGLLKLVENAKKLRRDDLIKTVGEVRDKFGQADLARRIAREWLARQQSDNLADSDAEGRFALAQDYLALLGDKRTAAALLREALSIDPDHFKSAESLAGLGWKKDGDRWIDPDEATASASKEEGKFPAPAPNLPGGRIADRGADVPAPPKPSQPPATGADPASLTNQTQDQIKARFGIHDRKIRSLTQGLLTEQWIYDTPSSSQVVQFVRKSARGEALVKAVYNFAK